MVTTDRNDARGIAQLLRLGWFESVHVKGALASEISFPAAVAYIVVKAALAIRLWGAAVIGYLRRRMLWWERILAAAAAFSLIAAIPLTDEVGFALAALAVTLYSRQGWAQ